MNNSKFKSIKVFARKILIVCPLLILFIFEPVEKLNALSPEWVGVPSSEYGEQFWDKRSIQRNADGSVRVRSKFIPKDKSQITKDILYTMDINCFEKSFRDISITTDQINEFANNNANWENPNEDKLILGIIGQVCNFED